MIFSVISAVAGLIYIIIADRGVQFSVMFAVLLLNSILINLRFGMANRFEYLLKSKKTVIAADIAVLLSSILQLAAVSFNCSIVMISVIAVIASTVNITIVALQYRIEFNNPKRKHFEPKLVKELIVESFPLAIAASCATIYTRCDSVMLGGLLTTAEVGIYSISVKLISDFKLANLGLYYRCSSIFWCTTLCISFPECRICRSFYCV